jgi:hypothetical protein
MRGMVFWLQLYSSGLIVTNLDHLSCVLVLEDDYVLARGLAALLKSHGCGDIVCIPRSNTALNGIFLATVDLAILDVGLGSESCHRVALIMAAGRVPFIYVTRHERQSLPELPDAPCRRGSIATSWLRQRTPEVCRMTEMERKAAMVSCQCPK